MTQCKVLIKQYLCSILDISEESHFILDYITPNLRTVCCMFVTDIQDAPPPPPLPLWKFQLSFTNFFNSFGLTELPHSIHSVGSVDIFLKCTI